MHSKQTGILLVRCGEEFSSILTTNHFKIQKGMIISNASNTNTRFRVILLESVGN